MVSGSISTLYLISKTYKKFGMEILLCDSKFFSQGSTGLTGAHHRSDRWWPLSHIITFLRPKLMKIVLWNVWRSFKEQILKMEEKGWNFRGYVGSTDMASLLNLSKIVGSTEDGSEKPIRAHWLDHGRSPVWLVPVTGLTGDARPQPVGPQ
jgi:hypothetical protein